jgi:hypothetical protein
MKYALVFTAVAALATPAWAEEVGVGIGVGPVGAGVTVGKATAITTASGIGTVPLSSRSASVRR